MENKKILMFYLLMITSLIIILYLPNSSASQPILGNINNIKICQDTGGKYLNINFKPPEELKRGYSVIYSTKDIFCKCGEDQFIKVTTINDWKGCNSSSEFIDENQFLEELNQIKNSVSSVEGDIDEKYIKTLEEAIAKNIELEKQKQLKYILVIILIVLIIVVAFYLIYKIKPKENKLKNFFKPTKLKIIIILILFLLTLILFWASRSIYNDSKLFYYFDLLILALPTIYIITTGIDLIGVYISAAIILIFQIFYWYLLSCILSWLINKIKNSLKKRN